MRMRNTPAVRATLTLVVVAMIAAACGSDEPTEQPQETGPVTLKVMNFANYMPEDIAERFEAETGHKMEVTLTSSNEDAIAKLQASPEGTYDVVFLTSPFAEGMIKAGGLETLDHEQIPNLSNLYPEATQLAVDVGNVYTVPYSWGTTGICYRTDLVGNETIDSWGDILDPGPDLAGKVTMLDEERWILMPALKTLGFSTNTTDPDELAQASEMTIAAKDKLLGFDAETFYTKLDSGEAAAVMGWDGWCNYVADTSTLGWALPSEGSDLWADMMAIPAGSSHVAAAHQFIDFILEPENGQWVAENILYKVPNKASMDALDPELLETYPNLAMSPADLLAQEALRDLGEGQPAFTDAVTKVKAS